LFLFFVALLMNNFLVLKKKRITIEIVETMSGKTEKNICDLLLYFSCFGEYFL